MNPEIKKNWLEALRSGRYEQGRLCMRRADNTWCCLGVLCDILDPKDRWTLDGDVYYYNMESTAAPSNNILKEIDLPDGESVRLQNMNDQGESFLEIAQYIEENL